MTARSSQANGNPIAGHRQKRILWLLANPAIWREAPSDTQDVDDANRLHLVATGEALIAAGLYSKRTLLTDRNWGLRILIGEARKRARAAVESAAKE